MISTHERYMTRCIQLAALGGRFTQTNPLVGAVLVYQNKIIGEGYHEQYGLAHAEVNCLQNVSGKHKHLIPRATLYVNLEPCNHTGKTPPCSHAIVKAGIKKVVIGTEDLNPMVAKQGIQYLREYNIEVKVGICEVACYKLNKVFFTNQKEKRAFVKLKWAQTADQYIGDAKRNIAISNSYTNIISHKYRTEIDGILVGYNTALQDQPTLNARHWKGEQPARIFLDWRCMIPREIINKTFQRTIVLNSVKTDKIDHIEFVKVDRGAAQIAKKLLDLRIASVLVEGGAKTHDLFIQSNIWDEAVVLSSNQILKKGIRAAQLNGGMLLRTKEVRSDTILHISNSDFIK